MVRIRITDIPYVFLLGTNSMRRPKPMLIQLVPLVPTGNVNLEKRKSQIYNTIFQTLNSKHYSNGGNSAFVGDYF